MWKTLKNTSIDKIPVLKRKEEKRPRFQGFLLKECSKNNTICNSKEHQEFTRDTNNNQAALPEPGYCMARARQNRDRAATGTRGSPGFRTPRGRDRTPSSPNTSDRSFPQGCHRDEAMLLLTRVTAGAGLQGSTAHTPSLLPNTLPHAISQRAPTAPAGLVMVAFYSLRVFQLAVQETEYNLKILNIHFPTFQFPLLAFWSFFSDTSLCHLVTK